MNRRILRRAISNFMVGLMIGAVIVALLPLFFILINLVLKGASSLSLDFFNRTPDPAGETGGGVMHAMVETDRGFTLMASDLAPGMEHSPGNTWQGT